MSNEQIDLLIAYRSTRNTFYAHDKKTKLIIESAAFFSRKIVPNDTPTVATNPFIHYSLLIDSLCLICA